MHACSIYLRIPLEKAQRIINLTASEKAITLQKARIIKMVIKVAVRCPNTPRTIASNINVKKGRTNFNKETINFILFFIFNNPF